MRITSNAVPYSSADTPSWTAEDQGLVAMTYDFGVASNAGLVLNEAGRMYVVEMKVVRPSTVATVVMNVGTAGVTLTAGQCFACVIQDGVLLGQTVDQSAAWMAAGQKNMTLAAPIQVARGRIHVGYWYNGTTGPNFRCGNAAGGYNVGLAAGTERFALSSQTGLTTTAPANVGTRSSSSRGAHFVALSAN